MKSHRRLQQRLPDELLETLAAQYEARDYQRIMHGFMAERPVTLRVNRLKTDVRTVLDVFRREDVKTERVSWYEDALIVKNRRERDLESHPLYTEGRIYLQSLSSMLPPLVLDPPPGSNVLDLTAAPGGKSTQLAALMSGRGFILANELNPIRAERLKFNLARQGATNVEVRVGDGKRLEERWREYFDAVLLDAPCSGVGLINGSDAGTYRGWSLKRLAQLAKEQRKLLESAFYALKAGGVLVYSTCTLMREENEAVVAWALDRFGPAIALENISLPLTGAGAMARRIGGKNGALLIPPSELYEGFFLAKLHKTAPSQ